MFDEDEDDAPGIGHNSDTLVDDQRLLLLIQRYETLDEEKKGISDDQKDVVAEVKAVGYCPKIFRQVVKIRKMNVDDRREQQMLLDTYLTALGLI